MIKKNDLGHWCGYVRIGDLENYEREDLHSHIHGGVTWGIDDNGWIGFDCDHAYDVCIDENDRTWGKHENYNVKKYGSVEACRQRDDVRVWELEDAVEETESFVDQLGEKLICPSHDSRTVYHDRREEWVCPFCLEV